jgi:ankyrin repeat protein
MQMPLTPTVASIRTLARHAAVLALSAVLVSCAGPKMTRVVGDWYVDDVAAGTPSPHLYWVRDGKPIVVDRQIRSAVHAGCVLYETSRPSHASVIFAVSTGKQPVAVATSDELRPWHLSYDGLRRFEAPAADGSGAATLAMDFVSSDVVCQRAWNQPPYTDDWAAKAPPDAPPVKVQHLEFAVDGADSSGNSILSEQVAKRQATIVDELLRAGANPNAANVAGITPLMTAVAFDADGTAILERLLAAGADIDAQDKDGMTALMHAARYGRARAAQALLAHGADAAIHDNVGRTAAAVTPDSKPELNRLLETAARRK